MNIENRNELCKIDGISVQEIADDFGTPCFVYSEKSIIENFKEIQDIFCSDKRNVFYSVKANSNLSILKLLSDMGSGFDIVSIGELKRVLKIGADPKKIIYSGVGKSESDIRQSIEAGIYCINVESFLRVRKNK